jgi:hypothetical protein
MTIIEQLVEEYKAENPQASPEQIKEYVKSLQQYTKIIKEDEYVFNSGEDDTAASAGDDQASS